MSDNVIYFKRVNRGRVGPTSDAQGVSKSDAVLHSSERDFEDASDTMAFSSESSSEAAEQMQDTAHTEQALPSNLELYRQLVALSADYARTGDVALKRQAVDIVKQAIPGAVVGHGTLSSEARGSVCVPGVVSVSVGGDAVETGGATVACIREMPDADSATPRRVVSLPARMLRSPFFGFVLVSRCSMGMNVLPHPVWLGGGVAPSIQLLGSGKDVSLSGYVRAWRGLAVSLRLTDWGLAWAGLAHFTLVDTCRVLMQLAFEPERVQPLAFTIRGLGKLLYTVSETLLSEADVIVPMLQTCFQGYPHLQVLSDKIDAQDDVGVLLAAPGLQVNRLDFMWDPAKCFLVPRILRCETQPAVTHMPSETLSDQLSYVVPGH